MAEYRVTLLNRQGIPYGTLPLSGANGPLTFGSVLNGGGSGTLSALLTAPLISGKGNRERLHGWASEIVVERIRGNGSKGIVAAGPVVNPQADLDSQTLTVPFQPLWAWMGERLITDTVTYGGWEQVRLAIDLMTRYTTRLGPAGDIRVGYQPNDTGVFVSQLYQPSDQKTVATAIADLSNAAKGFDFVISLSGTPSHMKRTWIAYPTASGGRGRRLTQPLTPGDGGLRNFAVSEAGQPATRVTGFGQLQHTEQANPAIENTYGIHSRAMSLVDSTSEQLLIQQVKDYLNHRLPPAEIVSFGYKPCPATPWGFLQDGDTVRVIAGKGWLDYDNWVRVIGQTTTVDAQGDENVALVAATVPGGLS